MSQLVIEKLHSSDWESRMSAQAELTQLTNLGNWISILSEFPASNAQVLATLSRILALRLRKAPASDHAPLLAAAFGEKGPLRDRPDLAREVLQATLSAQNISYRSRVEILLGLLKNHSALSAPVLKDIVRALGLLRARRAITAFEPLLSHPDHSVAKEAVRALQLIGDPNSARFLEALFGSSDREFAASAVEAYGQLGSTGLRRAWRLKKLYETAGPEVRFSVIAAVRSLRPLFASWLYRGFYARETDADLRLQILRRLSVISTNSTAAFLLQVASEDSDPRLSAAAEWALQAMPAKPIERTLKKALRAKQGRGLRLALLKAGQLPNALRALEPWIQGKKILPPMLHQTLVETVGSLASTPQLEAWLLGQIGKDPLSTITAASALLRRVQAPYTLIWERAVKAATLTNSDQTLPSVLSLFGDSPAALSQEPVIMGASSCLKNSSANVRYLAARCLARSGTSEGFLAAWRTALAESERERAAFATVMAQALSLGQAHFGWIADFDAHPGANAFLDSLLAFLNPTAWKREQWREYLLAASAPGTALFAHARDRGLILAGSQLLPELILAEKDPEALKKLVEWAKVKPEAVKGLSAEQLIERLGTLSSADPASALFLELLGQVGEREAIAGKDAGLMELVDWARGTEGSTRDHAYATVSRWLAKREAAHG